MIIFANGQVQGIRNAWWSFHYPELLPARPPCLALIALPQLGNLIPRNNIKTSTATTKIILVTSHQLAMLLPEVVPVPLAATGL